MSGSQNGKDNYNVVVRIIRMVMDALKQEKVSRAGKINIYIDLLLLAFFMMILVATSFDTFFIVVQNIFAMFLDNDVNELSINNLLICFGIFVLFSVFCLIFMHYTSKEEKALEIDESDDEK